MRALTALPFAAALAGVLAAPAAVLAEPAARPMSRSALVSTIKGDKVWCAGWRESDQSCEEVVFLETEKNAVSQTRRYRMSDAGDVEMVVRQTLTFDGAKLCWTYRFVEMDVVFLNSGVRAPTEQSAATSLLMREMMADLEGKKACEGFSRDDRTGEITSTVTLDGEPAPEFDSRFRLLAPDAKVKLRALFEETEDTTTT